MRIESGQVVVRQEETIGLSAAAVPKPDKKIEFASAFSTTPSVVVGIAGLTAGNGASHRVTVRAEGVTGRGFTLAIDWNRLVSSVTAFWIAYGDA